jgi:hypothetical protein
MENTRMNPAVEAVVLVLVLALVEKAPALVDFVLVPPSGLNTSQQVRHRWQLQTKRRPSVLFSCCIPRA